MPSARRLLLALLVSIALVTNTLWLFPADGEMRYTYERSELIPQGDDIAYEPPVDPNDRSFYNDLARVGCESVFGQRTDRDLTTRTCAFEQSIADDGPVTVEGYDRLRVGIGYVELDDGYYHRTVTEDDSSVTLDLQRVSARTVLRNVSTADLSEASLERIERPRVAARAVVSGAPVRSLRDPRDVAVGMVYAYEGDYYAVFVTGSSPVDAPVPDLLRPVLSFVGIVGLLSAVLLLAGELEVEEW